ncbi:helix-turn-helix transcriptional regulator [Lacticaseibacillus daqingensis]|uniref:helix-turn-helix transcriptional regulator n=1 Tax=Lacticaseibacillus daqingensis TaxID=2486014 RepID=UPI001CDC454D|nr:AraC family transcriptional regulator [Lacticaseibacillus daqingensis]
MLQTNSGTQPVTLDLVPMLAAGTASRVPFAILQNRADCLMQLPGRPVTLKVGDIALIRASTAVTLAPLTAGQALDARLFQLPIATDSGFGPNELISSMLTTMDDAHIVFRRIDHRLTNGYCDQLARLAEAAPQDALLSYEQGMLAHLLLTELSRSDLNAMMIIESDFPETDLRRTPKARQAGVILNYIMTNIATVTLQGAAAHFGYEPNYFSRLCHQLFQKPFSEEVRFIRMNQAKKLLELTPQSVNDIAFALGYKNPANFDHHFKAYTGQTPSEFRRAVQAQPLH